ncbi:g1851 [Coccomyxa viridis]|uniref:G1851 protein n=1 Tax=Coccomyxa viridis TaxID=1274662 RepID=A0ABP1FIY3_9CHLO
MKKARVAQGVGLLSLPDEILANIARESLCWRSKEYYSDWVSAAMTCKRLRDVQLPNFITVHNWESLKWHLKRSQYVKHVTIMLKAWPCKAHRRRKLSKELMEVSCNLKHLESLELYPVGREFPVQLEDWITGMLSVFAIDLS